MTDKPWGSAARWAIGLRSGVHVPFLQPKRPPSPDRLTPEASSQRSGPNSSIARRSPGFPDAAAFRVTVTAAGRTILDYTLDVPAQRPGVVNEAHSPRDISDAVALFFDEISRAVTPVINTFKQRGVTVVPEPTSVSVFALGLAGLAVTRRRRS